MSSALCSLSAISMKTVVILFATQQMLESADIPQVIDSGTIHSRDHLKSTTRLCRLRKVSFTFTTSIASNPGLCDIVQEHVSSSYLHVRCHSMDSVHRRSFGSIVRAVRPGNTALLDHATRLTLRGYQFSYFRGNIAISCPNLRALALIDCRGDVNFCLQLKGSNLPCLEALMVLAEDGRGDSDYANFIKDLHPLKELVLKVPFVWLDDGSSLLPHARSLELFCAHSNIGQNEGDISSFSGNSLQAVCQLKNVRHLSLFLDLSILVDESGRHRLIDQDLSSHLVCTKFS